MVTLFVVVAWLIALASWLGVSQATSGVAGMCFACFMVITARIAQPDRHQTELLARLASASESTAKSPQASTTGSGVDATPSPESTTRPSTIAPPDRKSREVPYRVDAK
jgi:hypothetical protein